MAERVWVDPRTVKRYHIGQYRLNAGEGGLTLGSEAAIEMVQFPERLKTYLYVPRATSIDREQILNQPDYKPRLEMGGDPEEIVPFELTLGFSEGRNNRVYVGSGISIARLYDTEAMFSFVVASANPKLEVLTHPPGINLSALLREMRSRGV